MKLSRFLILAAALLLFSVAARADTVDPAIGVRGCTGTSCSTLVGPPGTFSFTFTGTMGTTIGDQLFNFINNTGFTAAELDLFAPASPDPGSPDPTASLTYTCGDFSTYFGSCTITPPTPVITGPTLLAPVTSGTTLIRYFGGSGIPNDPCSDGCFVSAAHYQMVVQDVFGELAKLSPDDKFTVQGALIAAPVPEPATIALLSTGLGLLGISRRRKKQAASSAS